MSYVLIAGGVILTAVAIAGVVAFLKAALTLFTATPIDLDLAGNEPNREAATLSLEYAVAEELGVPDGVLASIEDKLREAAATPDLLPAGNAVISPVTSPVAVPDDSDSLVPQRFVAADRMQIRK